MNDLYLSAARFVCFDAADEGGTGAGAGAGEGGTPPEQKPGKSFTQDDVNKFLAEDRRKHQAKVEELQRQLDTASLSQKDRDELNTKLEEMQATLRSKEEQAKKEQQTAEQRHKTEVAALMKRAEAAEGNYTEYRIQRELLEAAVAGEAFNANQIVTLMRGQTKIGTEGQVLVDFVDVDEAGNKSLKSRSPEDAIKWMKDDPDKYGNLFKSNVVSGVGGNSATGGLKPGSDGRVDLKNMTSEQYRKMRKENPQALGLRS